MSNSIHDLLERASTLLNVCGWEDKASWFRERSLALARSRKGSEESVAILQDIDRAISGMGSFTDIPLTPRIPSMSVQEARDEQWDLAEGLREAIEDLMP